ncbi:hypothetical protein DM860_014885 [Cuscuta australis]|uniref:Uncharacterized protein n=1 Tax=Cuscuta australis TaxID=267555 RepID=A0A328DJ70_9ASTE|nr:hypothetical protein DM860_014885 [Cuscuta australis]
MVFIQSVAVIKVLEANMIYLPFEDQCFDVIVDKGTMIRFSIQICISILKSFSPIKGSHISQIYLTLKVFFQSLAVIKVLEANMQHLPFEDQCFDVIVDKRTMECDEKKYESMAGEWNHKSDKWNADQNDRVRAITPSTSSVSMCVLVKKKENDDEHNA